ncbi:MAG: pilus assembly protein [Chloroflexi bacterium]|nr:pilus assembly protein [Chloroflexota bacterium]MBU1751939.1 pilus assembly protein [Chloroflexota bacterium]MBU1879848.1 pilus assembly protein [Chloroflexota bacterium]
MPIRFNTRAAQGQSLVEFSLLLPILLLLVMGLLLFGIVFGVQITLTEAATAGARQAVVEEYCSLPPTGHHNTEIYDAVVNALGWLGKGNVQSIVVYLAGDDGSIGGTKDTINPASGSSTGNFVNSERCGVGIYVGVEVTYRQEVFIPFINLITGDEIILRAQRVEMVRQ